MGKLRLRDWKDITSNAGVYVLLAVLLGSLLLFSTVYTYSSISEPVSKGSCEIKSSREFNNIINNKSMVAVMFSSDTCPVCKKMEPHWRKLCAENNSYIILKLNEDTYNEFLKYGVLETPTFIVFHNGTPVARHIGGFSSPHGVSISSVMQQWVESSGAGTSSSLDLLKKYCSSCHPVPKSISNNDIQEWIASSSHDTFVQRFAQAYNSGMTLSQLYNGTSNLIGLIISMNKTITTDDAEKIALLLDNIILNRTGPGTLAKPQNTSNPNNTVSTSTQQNIAAMGTVAALTAGIIAAFSPCVFPLLLSYTAMLQSRRGDEKLGLGASIKSGLAAAMGVALVGALFIVLGNTVQSASAILVPSAAAVLFAAGLLGAMDVPTFVNIGMSTRRGLLGFSFLYGILAVQCSFPLVAGTFMLLAAGGTSLGTTGLIVLGAFTLGIAVPVALAVYASGSKRLRAKLARAASKQFLRYANGFLAVMGLVMLVYTLGLI